MQGQERREELMFRIPSSQPHSVLSRILNTSHNSLRTVIPSQELWVEEATEMEAEEDQEEVVVVVLEVLEEVQDWGTCFRASLDS